MGPKIFLDMDGVLANFVDGACIAHNRPYPYNSTEAQGIFDIEKLWEITPQEFWAAVDTPGKGSFNFWNELKPMFIANWIVDRLSDEFGEDNICVLTSPSQGEGCVAGKRAWMARHFPQFSSRMIFGSCKEFISGPGRILADDRDKNIEGWEEAGGFGILVPSPWNKLHHMAHKPWVSVNKRIEEWRLNG